MIRAPRSIVLSTLTLTLLYALSSVPAHALNFAIVDKLLAADGASEDAFGGSVAIDGDTALIAAGNNDHGSGSAYIFTRINGDWIQQQKLVPTDGPALNNFGKTVALDDNTALIGAYHDDGNDGYRSSSAYVFTRTGGVWTQQQKLVASDGAADDWQSGNALVVFFDGTGQRIAESFDGEENSAPLLHVEYK